MTRARDIANLGNGVDASDLTEGAVEGALTTPTGRRNLIINGAMQVAQRGTSAITSTAGVASRLWRADRFSISTSSGSTGVASAEVSTDFPDGFSSSLKFTVNTAQPFSGSGVAWQLIQQIEGSNFIAPAWGTSSAKNLTLSFWVKSSVTGTYTISLHNDGYTRNYLATYTINSANTWEYKTVTVPGDTSGTWLTTNGIGCGLRFNLGSTDNLTGAAGAWGSSLLLQATGSVDWGSTSGATFYITGIQLEVGTVATPFEHRSYGEELALCQRYYARIDKNSANTNYIASGSWYNSASAFYAWQLTPNMRATPTFVTSGSSDFSAIGSNGGQSLTSITMSSGSNHQAVLVTAAGSGTQGDATLLRFTASNSWLAFDAEL
jgi:hypothetical protein